MVIIEWCFFSDDSPACIFLGRFIVRLPIYFLPDRLGLKKLPSRACCGLTDSVLPNISSISRKVCGISSFQLICSLSSAESAFVFSLSPAAPPFPKPAERTLSFTLFNFFVKIASLSLLCFRFFSKGTSFLEHLRRSRFPTSYHSGKD